MCVIVIDDPAADALERVVAVVVVLVEVLPIGVFMAVWDASVVRPVRSICDLKIRVAVAVLLMEAVVFGTLVVSGDASVRSIGLVSAPGSADFVEVVDRMVF